jgi:siroheme synthase
MEGTRTRSIGDLELLTAKAKLGTQEADDFFYKPKVSDTLFELVVIQS